MSKTLKVGLSDWIGYAPFLLAQDCGYYDGWDIELRIRLDPAKRYDLFRDAQLDGIGSSINVFCREAHELNAQVVLALVELEPPGAERIVARDSFRTINDLRHAVLCFIPHGLEHFYFSYFFKHADVPFPQRTLHVESREEMRERFLNGEADAVILYEPLISRLTTKGSFNVVPTSADLSVVVAVLAVHREVIDVQREQVRACVDGYLRAAAELRSRPTEALLRLLRHYGANYQKESPLDDLRRKLEGLRYLGRSENESFLRHPQQRLRRAIKESIEIWQEMGALSYPPDTTRLINPDFVAGIAENAPC